MARKRRSVLATAGAVFAGSLSGCIFGGGSDDGGSDDDGDLSDNTGDAILAAGEGITVEARMIEHTPDENTAYVEGSANVPQEAEYRVRLGVADDSSPPVVLAETVDTQVIYPTGTRSVSADLEVENCEDCHTALVEVTLSENARDELQQEQQEQREREREQAQQQNASAAGNSSSLNGSGN